MNLFGFRLTLLGERVLLILNIEQLEVNLLHVYGRLRFDEKPALGVIGMLFIHIFCLLAKGLVLHDVITKISIWINLYLFRLDCRGQGIA
jgi:hypothetical protein